MKSLILCSLCILFASTVALADPVQVFTEQDSHQDAWALEGWVEELSTAPHSDKQLISSSWQYTPYVPCPLDYQGGINVEVTITNLTNRAFPELYYVGDVHDYGLETSLTNLDEWVGDVTPANAPWIMPGMAFKIDSFGLNTPLIFESITPDNVFEPGETWKFVIQEYANTLGNSPAALGSVGPAPFGAIAQASWFGKDPGGRSSGSIITPEPATICLLGLGGLLLRRKKRA